MRCTKDRPDDLVAKIMLGVLLLPGTLVLLLLLLVMSCFWLSGAEQWLSLRQVMLQSDLPLSVCMAEVELTAEIPDVLQVCLVASQDRKRVAQALSQRKDWHTADGQADWDALIASYIPGASGLLKPSGIDLWTSGRDGFALWDTQSGLLLLGKRRPARSGQAREQLERMGLGSMADALNAVPVLVEPVRWTGEMACMRAFLVPEAQRTAMLAAIARAGWAACALSGEELTRLQQRYLPGLDVLVPPQEAVFDWWGFVPEDVPLSAADPVEAFAGIGDWDAAFYDQDSGLLIWYRNDY